MVDGMWNIVMTVMGQINILCVTFTQKSPLDPHAACRIACSDAEPAGCSRIQFCLLNDSERETDD